MRARPDSTYPPVSASPWWWLTERKPGSWLTLPNHSLVAGVCWMLTPETRTAPPESAVPASSRPPRVTTGATRPLGSRYAELSPSRRYLLKSGVTVPAPPGSSRYVVICETLVMKALYRILHDRHVLSISHLDGRDPPAMEEAPDGSRSGYPSRPARAKRLLARHARREHPVP